MAEHHVLRQELLHGHGHPARRVAHQAGTCRFGTDPATSVLDVNCKAHELDNLYVVDTSFFPSIGAVNPALTAMANAIRVGEHLARATGADGAPVDGRPQPESRGRLRRRRSCRASRWSRSLRRARSSRLRASTACPAPRTARCSSRRRSPRSPRRCSARPERGGSATKRVYLVGSRREPARRWACSSASALLSATSTPSRTALLLRGHGLPRGRLRAHGARAQHADRCVPSPTSVDRVRARAQRAARARNRARAAASSPSSSASASGGGCRRSSGGPARRLLVLSASAAAAHRRRATDDQTPRAPAIPRRFWILRRVRACSTASARR